MRPAALLVAAVVQLAVVAITFALSPRIVERPVVGVVAPEVAGPVASSMLQLERLSAVELEVVVDATLLVGGVAPLVAASVVAAGAKVPLVLLVPVTVPGFRKNEVQTNYIKASS